MGLRCNNYVVISRNFYLVSWSSYIISRYCNVIPRCIVSIYLYIYLTIYLFVYIYLFVHIYLTIYLSIYMFLHLSIYLFISAAGYIKPPLLALCTTLHLQTLSILFFLIITNLTIYIFEMFSLASHLYLLDMIIMKAK